MKKPPKNKNIGQEKAYISYSTVRFYILFMVHSLIVKLKTFKEYLKLLNRLYDITWFGSVYASRFI
jgi:hypothetical protein